MPKTNLKEQSMKLQTNVFRRYPTVKGYTVQEQGYSPEVIANILKTPSNLARKNLIFVVNQTAYSLEEYKQLVDTLDSTPLKRPRIKPEVKEEIVKLEAKGFSHRSISKLLGVSVATVSRTLNKLLR